MSDQLTTELATIKKLHTELCGLGTTGLEKALQIGEMLTDIKGRFTHGNWTLWVESKLPFDTRQAQRYMEVYSKRKLLKGMKEINFTNALKVVRSKTTKKTGLEKDNQGVTENSQKRETSELTPEQQAEQDIKAASNPEQNGAPEKAVDAQGIPIPKEALPYWNRRQEVQGLMTAISRVKCHVQEAEKNEDRLFSWVSQNIVMKLESAYAALTNAMPYAVCVECGGHAEKIKCTVCHGTGLISKYAYDFQADKGKISIRAKAYANRPA